MVEKNKYDSDDQESMKIWPFNIYVCVCVFEYAV